MTRAPRVIIAYSRVGGGHLSVAQALAAAFEAACHDVVVRISDLYLDYGRYPLTRFPAWYATLARDHPRLWAAIFHLTNRPSALISPATVLRPFLADGVARLLDVERPDLVVSVLPTVNGVLAEVAAGSRHRPSCEVVLTDWFGVHRTWVAPGIDHYTTPTPEARADCVAYGAPPERVDVRGLPIRADFAAGPLSPERRREVRRSLAIDPERFTILAMVGAEGSSQALHRLRVLADLDLDAQLIVLCGRNIRLRERIERLPSRMPMRALGFVEQVADLFRSTDLLLTKAGGVTLAEAFSASLPIVVYDFLPGQEAGNLRYALQQGAVEYAASGAALADIVFRLRQNPQQRAALAARAWAQARPQAAIDTARAMLSRLRPDGKRGSTGDRPN